MARKGRVKALRTVVRAGLSSRCLVWRFSAERRNQQWIGALGEQRIADGVAVGARACEPMAGEHVGQRRERRAVLDAGDQVLRGAQRKAIAANADKTRRRRIDGEQLRLAIDAAGIERIDAALGDLQARCAAALGAGGKGA